jgi:hypothetical protein
VRDYFTCSNGVILTFLIPGEFEVKCDVKIRKKRLGKKFSVKEGEEMEKRNNEEKREISEETVIHKEIKTIQIFAMGDGGVNVWYVSLFIFYLIFYSLVRFVLIIYSLS